MGILDGLSFGPDSSADATGFPAGWLGLTLAMQPGASRGFDGAAPATAPITALPNASPTSGDAQAGDMRALLSPPPGGALAPAAPSFGDRLTAALTNVAAAHGLVPTLAGGVGAFLSPGANAAAPSAGADPGFDDRASAALMNMANARGFIPALAGMALGATTGQRVGPIPRGSRNGIGAQDAGAAPIAPTQAPVAATQGAPSAMLAQARAAMARGAPRGLVIQRLQQLGFDPTGL